MSGPNILHVVLREVLVQSRNFLAARGREGYEGTGLWIGRAIDDHVEIVRFFAPEQVATKGPLGLSVDLTQRAHYTLIDELHRGERFYARIHSHPGRAYHSARDDSNAVITHEGALSIVVPNFAEAEIRLSTCAIYRLEYGKGWLPLEPSVLPSVFKVIP